MSPERARPARASAERRTTTEVDGRRLTLSNLDKVLYPSGFTKGEVISYYVHVAPVLLPHLDGRPVTLVRFPDGTAAGSFFEKRVPSHAPGWVRTAAVPTGAGGRDGTIEHLVIDGLPALVWVANLAAIELHVPMWRVVADGTIGPVDTMVFDLDPGAPATVVECCEVAAMVRDEIDAAGLRASPKTSGSKGLQVYVPIDPPQPWKSVHAAARSLARRLERRRPELVLSNMRRSLRSGRVLIDWSQNHPAKTTVAPYSLRGGDAPFVSTPVTWDEVARCQDRADPAVLQFGPDQVLRRVAELGDLMGAGAGTRREA